jgi:hypothetical protein
MLIFKNLLDPDGTVARDCGEMPGTPDFARYCNDAVRQLMNRGDWWNTVVTMEGCVYDRTVTWPREAGTVLALNEGGKRGEVFNRWYQFTPISRADWGHCWGEVYSYPESGRWGNLLTENIGTQCVFNPIQADGLNLAFFISQPTDVGKKITIYGIDGNGQTIRSERTDGTFQDGYTMTFANPSVQTPFVVRYLSRVVKDETDGVINGYQWNAYIQKYIDLCQYEPTETKPEYVVSRITGGRNHCDCNHITKIKALVKLQFVPFKYPNDLVQISNLDSIRDMILSIKNKAAGDLADAAALEMSAIKELNMELRTKMPDTQTPVSIRAFGTANPRRHMIGHFT